MFNVRSTYQLMMEPHQESLLLQDMYLYLSSFVVMESGHNLENLMFLNKNVHVLNTMLHDKRLLYIRIPVIWLCTTYTVCLDTTQLIFSCW